VLGRQAVPSRGVVGKCGRGSRTENEHGHRANGRRAATQRNWQAVSMGGVISGGDRVITASEPRTTEAADRQQHIGIRRGVDVFGDV